MKDKLTELGVRSGLLFSRTVLSYEERKFAELVILECLDAVSEWKSTPFPLDADTAIKTIQSRFNSID